VYFLSFENARKIGWHNNNNAHHALQFWASHDVWVGRWVGRYIGTVWASHIGIIIVIVVGNNITIMLYARRWFFLHEPRRYICDRISANTRISYDKIYNIILDRWCPLCAVAPVVIIILNYTMLRYAAATVSCRSSQFV